jgi:hypothetical protein
MKLQSAFKLLLASSVAACCVVQADAQTVVTELSGTVDSLQGYGFANNAIGQLVTLDYSYDASAQTPSFANGISTLSAPITSAHTVGGAFGSGINLEPDGPGTGTVATNFDYNTSTGTATAVTSADAPRAGFTGSVFGFSFLSDGFTGTLELVRDAFTNGISNPGKSGTAFLSNVNVVTGGQAPEIDPASALSALTLLMGGLAVIRGKKFAKVPTA